MIFTNDFRLLFEVSQNKQLLPSWNPGLTIDMVITNIEKNWDWILLSLNFPWSDIKKHTELPWCERIVLLNKTINIYEILDNHEIYHWYTLSGNPRVTIDIVLAYFDKPWNWARLSSNSSMTPSIVRAHPNLPWDVRELSDNPSWSIYDIDLNGDVDWWSVSCKATSEIVLANLDKPWHWSMLSYHIDLSSENKSILKCDKIEWNYISCNKSITWDIIKANINKPWNWYNLSQILPLGYYDPTKSPPFSLAFSGAPVNYLGLSDNPDLTWEMVLANPDKDWDWLKLSVHPNIPYNIMCNNPDLPWRWDYVSMNPNMTWLIIRNNPGLLNQNTLRNNFAFSPAGRRVRIIRYYIQKWRHIVRRNNHRRHCDNFIHVMDHLKLYVRDKAVGTLRK